MEEMEIKQALSDAYKDPSKQFGCLDLEMYCFFCFFLAHFCKLLMNTRTSLVVFQTGHERVLLAMLSKEFPWKDAVDPTGDLALCP